MLRHSEILALILVISAVVWLDQAKLLWPAFIVAGVLFSINRWYRGWWPWPPREDGPRR